MMTSRTSRVDIYLRAPLATYMQARGHTVRELAYRVGDYNYRVSAATIGHLRKYTDRRVSPELARRLSETLGIPYTDLFVERVSTVTRNVAGETLDKPV